MKKRPRARASRPPTSRRPAAARPPQADEGPLQYKVVELPSVDEGALERTLNEWVRRGWTLDGIQFAMRESSKRPSMAFVLFTRPAEEGAVDSTEASSSFSDTDHSYAQRLADEEAARRHLQRLADSSETPVRAFPVSARDRLRQLAGDDDDETPIQRTRELELPEQDE